LDNCLIVSRGLLEGFREWLLREQGTSEGTVRKYMYYLPRIEGMALCGKQDVSQAFERMKLTKVSYEAFSRLLTYVEKKLEGYEELVAKLRRALPKRPKTREDTYVPPDARVRELLRCLEAKGQAYHLVALILAYTGLRGTEARFILENARSLQAVELPYGAVRVHMPSEEQERGTKRAYVAYMPKWLWERVLAYTGGVPHEDTIEKKRPTPQVYEEVVAPDSQEAPRRLGDHRGVPGPPEDHRRPQLHRLAPNPRRRIPKDNERDRATP